MENIFVDRSGETWISPAQAIDLLAKRFDHNASLRERDVRYLHVLIRRGLLHPIRLRGGHAIYKLSEIESIDLNEESSWSKKPVSLKKGDVEEREELVDQAGGHWVTLAVARELLAERFARDVSWWFVHDRLGDCSRWIGSELRIFPRSRVLELEDNYYRSGARRRPDDQVLPAALRKRRYDERRRAARQVAESC